MFQSVPPPIIRSTQLYRQLQVGLTVMIGLNRLLINLYTNLHTNLYKFLYNLYKNLYKNCTEICINLYANLYTNLLATYLTLSLQLTIPEAVCTVMCSWWWAEEPPETSRASIEETLHLVGCNLELYYDARTYECQMFITCSERSWWQTWIARWKCSFQPPEKMTSATNLCGNQTMLIMHLDTS